MFSPPIVQQISACLDDGERQHADSSHSSGARSEQNSLAGVGCPLQEVVLLQGVEGQQTPQVQLTAAKSILDLDAESSFSPGDAVLKLVNFSPRY
ncbi:hypothetical protein EYF80_006217 [Liparis tanakae]|uniref:Uncharacterized protein n=1 Tax=Liparis tanakae TaxID=230148 RepID=A0A4Z2J0F5_9TELE|nr:hypothetical protein EYF80_006217 [Liparis tanakae]